MQEKRSLDELGLKSIKNVLCKSDVQFFQICTGDSMEIIIAGAGMVGFRLATTLSVKHNVTVIDKNVDAINMLQEQIDIFSVVGNVEDPSTYSSILGKQIDLFIAVTDSDETNIIACLIIDEGLQVKDKIVRLRNAFFAKSSIALKLGITESVFPIMRTANSVKSLLDFPKANSVKKLNQSDFRLISIRAQHKPQDYITAQSHNSDQLLVIGIERNKDFFIPKPNDVIKPNDLVYFFGAPKEIKSMCSHVDSKMPIQIKKIVIFGADSLGIEIAKKLVAPGVSIKLIERSLEKCKLAAEILQNDVTIISSQYGNDRLIKEEGLQNADMIIATSKNDEENIVKCIEAKEYGVEKVVAINNDPQKYALMHKLGIIVVRGQKNNAYYAILEKIDSSSVVHARLFCGGSAVALTRIIYSGTELIGKIIQPYSRSEPYCIYIRGGKVFAFTESLLVEENDYIMAFCTIIEEQKVKKWIYAL